MKKLLFLSIIAFFAFSSANAQKGISFGLRAIPVINWTTVTDNDSINSYETDGAKMGIGFGPSIRYKFSDNFNVDVSGIFSWEKFTVNQKNDQFNPTPVISVENNIKYQNLYIPLNLNGQFDVGGDFQALINFGVAPAIKLSSMRQVTDDQHPNDPNSNVADYEPFKSLTFIDFFLTAGAGVVYNIEDNLHLSLTIQYNNGLLDGWLDNKEETPDIIKDLSLKHKNVAFSFGFYIDL